MIREMRVLAIWFGLPFLGLVLAGLSGPSPLPLWHRLLTLEDTCSYGICFVVPLLTYAVARLVLVLIERNPSE